MLSSRLPLAIRTHKVKSFDGTELAVHTTREPFPGAPVVVLANGLGGTHLAWRGIIAYLHDRCRFVTWDYRGLYESQRPRPDTQAAYAIPNQAKDLAAILDAENIERASFVGWSMGVQVVLEASRTLRSRMQNLVLLNGTYGRPLDTLSPLPGMKVVLPSLLEIARRVHTLATQMTRKATALPEAVTWFKRLGLVGPTLDDELFGELVHAFGSLDMEPFFRNLRAIGEHDASDLLEGLQLPVLVVTGDKDVMTPPALASKMAKRIPNGEILVVRGGTHYTAVEFPELVSLRIERFYKEHGVFVTPSSSPSG